MEQIALLISGLESKLKGLPPTNTFHPDELYKPPTNLELEKAGIITELDGVDPRFTPRGFEIFKTMDRMKHYFLTYKDLPGKERDVEITHTFGVKDAHEVIKRSMEDYSERFERLDSALSNV